MKKQRKKKTLAFKNAVAGYLFIAPFILGFILFMIVPLGQSLMMTFNEVNLGTGGFDMNWVGIKNYMDAFTVDPEVCSVPVIRDFNDAAQYAGYFDIQFLYSAFAKPEFQRKRCCTCDFLPAGYSFLWCHCRYRV